MSLMDEARERVRRERAKKKRRRSRAAGPSANGHAPDSDSNPAIHLTDLGNARRVVARYGQDLRYCHPWKSWLVWDGQRWAEDDTAEAVRRVKETQGFFFDQVAAQIAALNAAGGSDKEQGERLDKELKHALRWESQKLIDYCVRSLSSEPGIPILPDYLDREAFLLNCLNGTIDLQTGQLREHCRTDHITKLCPTAYDPKASAPLFQQFLQAIFDKDDELIAYLQRLFGYSLTGDVREQILAVFWGSGANGKSTLIGAVTGTLGEDYATKANRDLFMSKKGDNHPAQLARLFGKRLVVCVESQEGARLDEGLVKELTGGDRIAGRRMRENWWEFDPTHKAILVTNHKPEIRGSDLAIWRRIRLVPYTKVFPEDEQDKELGDKLKAEAPGILRWMVEGCMAWQRDGLRTPDRVMAATKEYRSEQDRLGEFINECCVRGPDYRVKRSELYQAFQSWCKRNGETEKSAIAFGMAMAEKGFQRDDGRRWYLQIALRHDLHEDDEGVI
jgi:putative DNA primase/helicase